MNTNKIIKFISLCVLSGSIFPSVAEKYKLEELLNADQAKLNSYFAGHEYLDVELNLRLTEIGNDKTININKLKAKQLSEKNGFSIEVSAGPYYLQMPNQVFEGEPICQAGMVSAGATVYSLENGGALEFIHSCGSAGCGYTFNYYMRPVAEICGVLSK